MQESAHRTAVFTTRRTVAAAAFVLSLAACGRDGRTFSAGGDVANDTALASSAPASSASASGRLAMPGGAVAADTIPQRGAMSAEQAEDVVEDALRADSTLAAFRLDADDERGRVVIEGLVATTAQQARAAEIAARVAPGVPIENKVRVDAAAARRKAAAARADEADDRIEHALEADSTLGAFDLDADDENGRVVLTGTVRTAAQRQLAEDIAKRVAPDVPVDNRIRVE